MKTILIIDDDGFVRSTFALALSRHGYRVVTAADGEEGLTQARRHFPDLILCDVNMPGIDGRTVLQSLRADPELAGKQFVLVTGNRDISARDGMELGADDFLVKPCTPEALLRCVEARLKRADVHWRVEEKMLKGLRAGLHSTLPHEFFTPLAGVLGLVEVLRGDIAQLRPAELHEILDDIDRSGRRLHRTLKNYLLMLDLESPTPTSPPAPLELDGAQAREFLAGAINEAAKRHQRLEDISIIVEPPSAFRVPSELATIAEELVENACGFSRKGTPITVQLAADRLTVTDQGRGMTEQEIWQIGVFQQFDRKQFEQQGLGLGLAIVQRLAARNRGRLEIHSEPGKSTIATVTFGTG